MSVSVRVYAYAYTLAHWGMYSYCSSEGGMGFQIHCRVVVRTKEEER